MVGREDSQAAGAAVLVPKTGGVKQQELIVSVLKAKRPKARCQQGHVLCDIDYLLAVLGIT